MYQQAFVCTYVDWHTLHWSWDHSLWVYSKCVRVDGGVFWFVGLSPRWWELISFSITYREAQAKVMGHLCVHAQTVCTRGCTPVCTLTRCLGSVQKNKNHSKKCCRGHLARKHWKYFHSFSSFTLFTVMFCGLSSAKMAFVSGLPWTWHIAAWREESAESQETAFRNLWGVFLCGFFFLQS